MSFAGKRLLVSWFSFWVVLAILCLYYVLPLRKNLKYGIDLVGGTYITLDVEGDKAVEYELKDKLLRIPEALKAENRELPVKQKLENEKIELEFNDELGASQAQLTIKEDFPELVNSLSGNAISLYLPDSEVNRIKKWALQSNIDVLSSRLQKIGVEEITVSAKGSNSIIVELPDVDNPTKAKEMIGTPAILELKIVEKMGSNPETITEEYGGSLPDGMVIVPDKDVKKGRGQYYLVSDHAEVTGRDFRDVMPSFGRGAEAVVSFRLTSEGARKFADLTAKNVGRELAAILDGKAVSVATIREEIPSGEGSISGRFTMEKAKELASLLKSGSFVAPVSFAEERRIGPSLGYDSVKSGFMACLIGIGLLLIFCVVFYKASGIFAFVTLLYNLLLILVGLSVLRATLTLPGIAGMILTLGMAIDASILIFERIREALAAGMSPSNAVDEGFSDAMSVILDANITHLIVAVVLFWFGTGPIRGFAVTMMIGIISTLLTGIFFLRSIFSFVLSAKKVKKLSI